MKTVTIYTKSGHQVIFQTNVFKLTYQTETDEAGTTYAINKIAYLEVAKKEKGISYEFVDYEDVAAITTDTSE